MPNTWLISLNSCYLFCKEWVGGVTDTIAGKFKNTKTKASDVKIRSSSRMQATIWMAHIFGYSDLIAKYYQVWFILIGLLAAAHKSGKEARKPVTLILLHVVLLFLRNCN